MHIDTLHETTWLNLHQVVAPEYGVHGYVYAHEVRCGGNIAIILPFRVVTDAGTCHDAENTSCDCDGGPEAHFEVLLRHEVVPCWNIAEKLPVSISGCYSSDDGEIINTAVRELCEESGYGVDKNRLTPLGTCCGVKSSDTIYHLYAVDLTDVERDAECGDGDGSELERDASCEWVHENEIIHSPDPLVHVARNRLMSMLYRICRQH